MTTNYRTIPVQTTDFAPQADTLVLFDNGEICKHHEEWPFALATHYLVPVPDSIILTQSELEKIVGDAFDNVEKFDKQTFIDNLLNKTT